MNGNGLSDLVFLRNADIRIYPSIGADGRVHDLRAISKLSPHQQDDPEELLLSQLDNTVDEG